jgi:hypothetical protein
LLIDPTQIPTDLSREEMLEVVEQVMEGKVTRSRGLTGFSACKSIRVIRKMSGPDILAGGLFWRRQQCK